MIHGSNSAYNVEIYDAGKLNAKTFDDLVRALENPYIPHDVKTDKGAWKAICMSQEEFYLYNEIVVSSKNVLNSKIVGSLPYSFREYIKEMNTGDNITQFNAIFFIEPEHLDGAQTFLGEDKFPMRDVSVFGRRPKKPISIMEKFNLLSKKSGTIYFAKTTPDNNYLAITTKTMAGREVPILQGALVRNENVSIVNLGESPLYVFLKKEDCEPIMLHI